MTDVPEYSAPSGLVLPHHISLETSRRCNRTCVWCRDGLPSARHHQDLMDFALFRRIIDELGELGYPGQLAFHNYNEPLLNRRLLDEIGYVRASMPAARPAIHTTGEVLDDTMFRRLIRAGVGYLRVTRYPRRAESPPSYGVVQAWLRHAGLLDNYQWRYQPIGRGLAAVLDIAGFRAEVISPAPPGTNYDNRSAMWRPPRVAARSRTRPCPLTTTNAVIDFRGRMKMCPHVHPQIPAHAGYLIGDLRTQSFAALWESARMMAYRNAHTRADWSHSPICAACTHGLTD